MYFEDEITIYEEILSGIRAKFPNGFFFDKNSTKKVVRYAVCKEYGDNLTKDIILGLDSYFFINRRLKNALQCNSPFALFIVDVFDDFDIEPFELSKVPNKYWRDSKNRANYVRWLFKKFKIDINDKNSIRSITADVVIANYGSRALKEADGLYNLLNEVLCYKYEIWEIMEVPVWNDELARFAVVWLLETKLKYSKSEIFNWKDSDITKKCTNYDIISNNLEGLWKNMFGHSTIKMVRAFY